MKEIGDYLRQARIEKNISLQDVQEMTKIRLPYLKAMEEGNWEAIPGEVYRKGFLVNFANAIGLDGQKLLEEYNHLSTTRNEQVEGELAEHGERSNIIEKKKSDSSDSTPKRFWIIMAVVVLLGAGAGLWATFTLQRRIVEPSTSIRDIDLSSQPVPEPEESSATVTTQLYPAPVTVTAEFSDRVWLQILADGKRLFIEEGIIFDATSSKQVWTAETEMVIKIGNPAGVRLRLNGNDLGPLGQQGVPRTITLTPNGMLAP